MGKAIWFLSRIYVYSYFTIHGHSHTLLTQITLRAPPNDNFPTDDTCQGDPKGHEEGGTRVIKLENFDSFGRN